MDIDEQQIANYLRNKGFRAEEFAKEERRQSRTPDFRVLKGNKLAFFCEVKTVSSDDWLDHQIESAPPGTYVGGARKDPIFNRLSSKIHEAVQQFEAVNPDLEYPNVLAFVNHDKMCGFLDLIAVTTGHFLAEGGGRYPIYLQFSEGRIKEEKFRIHLYIWRDWYKEKKYKYIFNTYANKHLNNLCSHFGIDPEFIKNI